MNISYSGSQSFKQSFVWLLNFYFLKLFFLFIGSVLAIFEVVYNGSKEKEANQTMVLVLQQSI